MLESVEVLPIDLQVSRVHARIWADLRVRGALIGAHDLLIAATALHHDFAVATQPRDFKRVDGLAVEIW